MSTAGVFWMISVVVTATMAFISVVVWVEARKKEREEHYRNEMASKIAEAADSSSLMDYVRANERSDAAKVRLKARISGLITIAVGIAVMIFLFQVAPDSPVYLAGLLPFLIGVALLIASEIIMKPKD